MATPEITDNFPSPGFISWAGFHIQYEGVGYEVLPGNTAERWTWWRLNDGSPILESGAEVPQDLTEDDVVLFGNKEGVGVRVQNATLIDGELLVDGSILAKSLNVNAVTTDHLLAGDALVEGLLRSGSTVTGIVTTNGLNIGTGSWTEEGGIDIPGVMKVPADGSSVSEFIGALTAERLDVKNYLKIMGLINSITQGAEVVMDNGPMPPDKPPTVISAWPKLPGSLGPDIAQEINCWTHIADTATVTEMVTCTPPVISGNTNLFPGLIERYTTGPTTTLVKSISLGYYDIKNIKFIHDANLGYDGDAGSFLMVGKQTSTGDWYILKCTSSFTTFTTHRLGGPTFFTHDPVIEHWGSGVFALIGWKNDGVLTLYTPPTSDPGATGTRFDFSGYSTPFDIKGVSGVTLIPGGEGQPNGILLWRESGNALAFTQSTRAYNSARNVPRANGKALIRGDGYVSLDDQGDMWRYQYDVHSGDLAYSWVDYDTAGTGQHETALSTKTTIAVSRGASIGFIIPAVPDAGDADSPNYAGIYGREGTNPYRIQGVTNLQNGYLQWLSTVGGTYPQYPTFATSSLKAARLKSSFADVIGPLLDFFGSGAWRLGDLQSVATAGRFKSLKTGSTGAITGTYTGQIDFVRFGQMVFATGYLDRASGFNATSHDTTARIPAGFRPATSTIVGAGQAVFGATSTYRYRYLSSGVIELQQSAAIGSFQVADAFWITADA